MELLVPFVAVFRTLPRVVAAVVPRALFGLAAVRRAGFAAARVAGDFRAGRFFAAFDAAARFAVFAAGLFTDAFLTFLVAAFFGAAFPTLPAVGFFDFAGFELPAGFARRTALLRTPLFEVCLDFPDRLAPCLALCATPSPRSPFPTAGRCDRPPRIGRA